MNNIKLNLENLPPYPLTQIRDLFMNALAQTTLLLEAEPGAGKSTLAPLWALASQTDQRQVVLVQPRVLAAQTLAQRLADLCEESLGTSVGYQVAYESRSSSSTRLLVVTPGVLLQKLLADPLLENIGCILLDEIHERSWQQDLLWSLLQECKVLRDDLRLVFMSATPDPQLKKRTEIIFNAQSLFIAGRNFPVTTHYLPAQTTRQIHAKSFDEVIEQHVMRALTHIDQWQAKTILVFLSGWYDIEKCAQKILEYYPQHPVFRLHSRVPNHEQQNALNPRSGPRIILSTNIAETSLTIEDVNCVIDSGLANKVDFEQATGLQRLKKSRISQASADQRRGRAGRVQAGECIRLWSQDQWLAPADLPEIRSMDLLSLALTVRTWGASCQLLAWIESPNTLAIHKAERQLQTMGLLDKNFQITKQGKKSTELGTHPRVATFLFAYLDAFSEKNLSSSEKIIPSEKKLSIPNSLWLFALALHFDLDFDDQMNQDIFLSRCIAEYKRNYQWSRQLKRWQKVLLGNQADIDLANQTHEPIDGAALGKMFARAYPDRIGFLQTTGRYKLNSNLSLVGNILFGDDFKSKDWAVFPWVRPASRQHYGLGFILSLNAQEQRLLSEATENPVYKNGQWQLQTQWQMGGCVIDQTLVPLSQSELKNLLIPYLQDILRAQGLNKLMSPEAFKFLERARIAANLQILNASTTNAVNATEFAKSTSQHQLDLNHCLIDEYLIDQLDDWLLPFLRVETSLDQLPWLAAMEYYLGFDNCEQIKQQLPKEFCLPSGRSVTINYATHDYATHADGQFTADVAGKLQEFFGAEQLQIARGKIPLKIHLLSPNGSPLAITQDLASFWKNAYPDVKKEMRGRYPRHPWPDDPAKHQATALTKKAFERNNK